MKLSLRRSAVLPPRWLPRLSACMLAGAVLVAGAALTAVPAAAKTLRVASAFDPQSMDPHALALQYQTRVVSQIYESLVNRNREYQTEPALALSWQMVNATTWRFKLRPDVKFHDGTPFTADDAVFSIQRALAKTSQRANQMRGITGARKVDALTIDVVTANPDAVVPDKLWLIGMMSKAWCEQHGVTQPQDYNGKQETFAVRNANGTGPFKLERYDADARTVLKAHAGWWGKGTPQGGGNLDEAVYSVIQSDATRMAALQSKEVDLVLDPPFQDLPRLQRGGSLKFATIGDVGEQYLAMDQHSAELPGVPGKNPFKDVRVRRAIQLAIDTDLIVKQVLRGQGTSTGAFIAPQVDGYSPEFEQRPPHDLDKAKALLKEAGYANGFPITLDCVNVAWRAAACQAMAAMLEKAGLQVKFVPSVSSVFFPKLTQASGSFMEFGWSPNADAWNVLNSLVRSNDGLVTGAFNAGRYANPKLDALIDAIRVQPDIVKRRAMIADALRVIKEDVPVIPLYRRKHNYVMQPNVSLVQWPNDVLELRWVTVQ